MTKTFKRIIITAVVLIAVAAAASALVLSGGCSSSAASPFEDAKNGAVNAVIDASGIKEKVESTLRAKAAEVAEETGIPQSVVDGVIDSLAIEDWQATSLPADASATGTYEMEAGGTTAKITTYDDPSIVTVDAYGQSVTMEVPESARGYLSFASYLDNLDNLDDLGSLDGASSIADLG